MKNFGKAPLIYSKEHQVSMTESPIDTTLAFYRRKYVKRGVTGKALRLREPYTARHLDWYLDPEALTEDQLYYLNTCKVARLPIGAVNFSNLSSTKKWFPVFRRQGVNDVCQLLA